MAEEHITVDSKQRVAFDLLKLIHSYESANQTQEFDRDYFMALYYQCHRVVSGVEPDALKQPNQNQGGVRFR